MRDSSYALIFSCRLFWMCFVASISSSFYDFSDQAGGVSFAGLALNEDLSQLLQAESFR